MTSGYLLTVLTGLSLALAVAIGLCTALGSTLLGPTELLAALSAGLEGRSTDPEAVILLQVRLPRVLLAGLVGAALSAGGVAFQALLRNPLAEPYILGVSGGAAFGAMLAIALGAEGFWWGLSPVPLCAFLGALFSLWLLYALAQTQGRLLAHTLLLVGVILNAFFSAGMLFFTSLLDSDRLHQVVLWLMGSLGSLSYRILAPVALYVILGLGVLWLMARDLNLLSLGEETAQQLGVDVERLKRVVLLAASLLTGAAVSLAGLIAFVGLIVPHVVRLLFGPDHRLLMPAAALLGAIFLMAADTLARTLMAPTELPVGVITALGGGPFFLWLLRRQGWRACFG
ncbi:MAG: iron ABC transporter permease [Candidatus Tectomicrobia bacterium]|uniref:Iron ABC transporter permease n=1 Tax=Tectimicrobiota bacterium TaxID=2528274 RepID=A0A932CLS2_UNCTE|nr:iron ABC transporter permease [Candidatus Tectomicrobia bacterium]